MLGLIICNLIFVAGPAAGAAGAYIGLWAAAAGLVVGAAGGFASILFMDYEHVSQIVYLSMMSGGLGVLLAGGLIHAGASMYRLVIKYVKWNVKLAQRGHMK